MEEGSGDENGDSGLEEEGQRHGAVKGEHAERERDGNGDSANTAPVKKSAAVSVRSNERRLIWCCWPVSLFFFFEGLALGAGRRFMPQSAAGRPMSRVRLVTLLTRALVRTSAPGPFLAPR